MKNLCKNCGDELRTSAVSDGNPFDSYHEYSCKTCGRRERYGYNGVQVRFEGFPNRKPERPKEVSE